MFNPFDGTFAGPPVGGYEDRVSNPSNNNYRIDWNAIINQGFAVGSQAINAFGGRTVGTQIGYNPSQGGVFAIQPSVTQGGHTEYPNPYAGMTPAQIANYQRSLGGGVGSGIDGALQWATDNPAVVFGAIAALYLLFKDPPNKGRR